MKTYGRSSTVLRRRARRLGSIVARSTRRNHAYETSAPPRAWLLREAIVAGAAHTTRSAATLTNSLLRSKVHGMPCHTHTSQRHERRLPGEMCASFTDVPKRQGQTIGH